MYENTKEENRTVKKIAYMHMMIYEDMCVLNEPNKVINSGKGAI